MGFSVAILAFALEDAPRLLDELGSEVTQVQVGQAIDPATMTEEMFSQACQDANNPHFSAARGEAHFFVYTSLSELGPMV
jgi:hypothetical protein